MNEKNDGVRYKATFDAHDFSQRPSIYCEEIYSNVVDAIILRFLIRLTVHKILDMRLICTWSQHIYIAQNFLKDLKCMKHVI